MNSKMRKYLTVIALGLQEDRFISSLCQIRFLRCTDCEYGNQQYAVRSFNDDVYGLQILILYIPGGILADKISAKKALVISLAATSVLEYIYAFTMKSFAVSMMIWLALSLTTAFVFWSSLMKAVRIIGTEEEQGFMYGLYYACNGITNALTNAFALKFFNTAGGDLQTGFFRAVLAGGSIAIVAGILLMVLMKEKQSW